MGDCKIDRMYFKLFFSSSLRLAIIRGATVGSVHKDRGEGRTGWVWGGPRIKFSLEANEVTVVNGECIGPAIVYTTRFVGSKFT